MVRRLLVGVAVAALTWAAEPTAAATAERDNGVRFTVGGQPGESTLRAEGQGVTFTKRLTADRVHVRIDVPGDYFALEARPTGTARLSRNGKSIDINMTAARAEVAKAEKFMAGSKALAGFEALAAALESSSRPEAQSVLTSFALLHAVRGSASPARGLARSVRASLAAHARWAAWGEAQPRVCWSEYSATVNQAYSDYSSCYLNYGWLPGMQAVCTFEWSLRVELAWFWLITCSGGIPAV